MNNVLENPFPNRIEDQEKAHTMALAAVAVRTEAVRQRNQARRIAEESRRQQESIIETASQKDLDADEKEMEAGLLYDVRLFLHERQVEQESVRQLSELTALGREVMEAARETKEQIDLKSGIGEQIELDAIENLLRCSDLSSVQRAIDIIENPRSEFFTRSFDGEQHKQLAYRDLTIAAYEGGLLEEAQALETLVKWYKIPLLFVKANSLEEAVLELLEEVGSAGVEEYKAGLKSLASRYIAKGNLEPARMIVNTLADKRKFALLAEMVEAGDETSIPAARESALELRKELGAREIPHGYSAEEYRIRALLRLYDAGDEGALELALSVAESEEDSWMRIKLLGWLGSEIQKRS